MGRLTGVLLMIKVLVTHYDDGNAQRRADFLRVKRRLQQEGVDYEVFTDTVGRGCWWTSRHAWRIGLASGAEYIMQLGDDMLPICTDFSATLDAAATAVGRSAIMSFFSMRKMCLQADGSAWCSTPDGSWGGSIFMHRLLVERFLHFADTRIRPDYHIHHADRRISYFAMDKGLPIYVSSRHILEHIGAAHSSVGHSNARRVASNPWHGSGMDIDWTAGLPDPPKFSGTVSRTDMREALL